MCSENRLCYVCVQSGPGAGEGWLPETGLEAWSVQEGHAVQGRLSREKT